MGITANSPKTGTQNFDPLASLLGLKVAVKNPGERPQDFPGGFVITEYIDGIAQLATQIKLIGNMMPMQPFPWEREQRMVKEYYPGNPEANVQMMGPKHGPTTIKGRFKDKRYKNAELFYGVSYIFSKVLDQFLERGNLMKFSMSGPSGNWTRFGFIEKNSWKMNKLSWIDYEITLFIVGEKQPVNNYFAARERIAPDLFNQKLIAAATAFTANYSTVPKFMPTTIAGLMNSLISKVAVALSTLTNFVGTAIGTVENIENSANRALGLIQHTRQTINQLRGGIDSIVHTFSSHSKQGNASGRTIDTYRNLSYLHETSAASADISTLLTQMQAQFNALAKTLPKARYKVHAGDTLQTISIKFYGISDNWEKIQHHNKLQSTILVAGTILEIPKV